MNYDCIVIGAGAAGMMAAIAASSHGAKTAVIEHTDKMGKKILQTGNGRCNLTNLFIDKNCYKNDDKQFVMNALQQFSVEDTLQFFKGLGLYPKSRNGYLYPNSDQAASVADLLKEELENQKVDIIFQANTTSIHIDDILMIRTDKGDFFCKSLIIATGSKASPKTGSDGSGYRLAKALGHRIIEPLPALVQLKSNLKTCKIMSGVRSEGRITLYIEDKEVSSDTGEIQYTDYGVSGIPVFQISRDAVRSIYENKKTEVAIDMFPLIPGNELLDLLMNRKDSQGYKTIDSFFAGFINRKLIAAVLKTTGTDAGKKVSDITVNELKRIVSTFQNFRIPVNGYHSFENGQICSGGVDLKSINSATMESRSKKGIYFAGEIMDVDGICGGYNLQWAWTSGYIAGKHAALHSLH